MKIYVATLAIGVVAMPVWYLRRVGWSWFLNSRMLFEFSLLTCVGQTGGLEQKGRA